MGSSLSSEQSEDRPDNMNKEFLSSLQSMSLESQSLQPKKLRKPLVTILSEILNEKAKLNEDLVKENNAILKEFLATFIVEMKSKDKIFDSLFQRIHCTGSFYSNLRVSTPDEYDLNLVLALPFKSGNVQVQYQQQVPSYVKYQTTDTDTISKENLGKLFENGYLIPSKVRIWIQSVVDKALTTYRKPRNVSAIRCSGSGPARTVILVKTGGGCIDIDLVPAIECSMGVKPPGIDGRVYEKVKNNLQCFLVPKPYQPSKQAPVSPAEQARLWRAHYPKAEDDIIYNLQCVKSVIKLLKLLRDKENWKILASYYLKTVIMWIILKNPSPEYWRQDKLGERFLEALNTLANYVKERKIPYFFSSRYNLVEKLTEAQASNIYHRLSAIVKDIEKDNNNLWNIFNCRQTFSL